MDMYRVHKNYRKKNYKIYIKENYPQKEYKDLEEKSNTHEIEETIQYKDKGIDAECKRNIALAFLALVGLEIMAAFLTLYRDVIFK